MAVPILTREQLLDYSNILSIFKSLDAKEEIKTISELKNQCIQNGISIRDFDKLLKMVQQEIENQLKPVATIDNNCLPSCIKNVGENYCISDNGVELVLGKSIIEVCPHPIFPIRILKDIDTGFEKVQIAFKRKGIWQDDIILDRHDIATNKGVIKLANYGILVNDANAGYIVKYFCDIEKLNEDEIKPVYATSSLGYSKYGFIPYTSDVIYNCNNIENKRRFELYKEHGDFEIWKNKQIECFKYTIPKIMVAGAYASLLIEKLGINPFGIHIWGETGLGKSVVLLTSASVYGYPDIKNGIVYTGNATSNGLEPRLAFNKNCAFYLDELSMLSAKQIDEMIYLIMQGQGKARMDKQGNTKNTYYWNLVSISNAEMPITNDLSKGGTYNRIYQIGAKEKVFGDMELPEIANTFKNNYGFGAKLFIELLEKEEIQEEIKQLKKEYYNQIIAKTEDKQANAGACIMTAFEIARKYIYNTDIQLTAEEIKQYLHTPDEISQVLRAYERLGDWIDANYKMFDNSEIGASQSKWGTYNSTNTEVNIYPYKFTEFCNNIAHINEKQFLTGLRQHELIKCMKGEFKNNVKVGDKTCRMITVKKLWVKTITESHNQDKNSILTPAEETDDLPF